MKIEKRATIHKKGTRKLEDITLAVVHYTGSLNLQGTLSWLEDERSKVSAQYVIARNGDVFSYNDLYDVLWHCGKSEWGGKKWCNRRAIGYELVGTFDSGFTDVQIDTLLELLYNDISITAIDAIVGHEHISPNRKIDPGPEFDWSNVRNAHIIRPFRNYRGQPINHIGAYPVHHSKKTHNEEIEIESGKDSPWEVWKPLMLR